LAATVVLAQAGQRVLLVDADLRRPTVHRLMDVSNRRGLTSLLVNQSPMRIPRLEPGSDLGDLRDIVCTTAVERLWVVPSGPLPPNPSELLASLRMRSLLAELCQAVDVVILDSPPVLPVSDPAVLTGIVDGTIVVVNARKTRGQQAAEAVSILQKAGGRVLGAVLNRVPTQRGTYGYYESPSESSPQVAHTAG
jgi:polysaccharide biosynthesis transport protein